MNAQTLNQPVVAGRAEDIHPLIVLTLYEDSQARGVAQAVHAHLMEDLSREFEFDCTWCELNVLSDAEIARDVTSIAVEADLIVFATRADSKPSATMKQWVETWVGTKAPQECALVALIAENTNQKRVTASEAYLRDVARRARMDFLWHVVRLDELSGRRVGDTPANCA